MNITMIEAAARRLSGHVLESPLLNSPLLDRIAGRRIFVKAESLQPTGSFKARGGWAAVSALPDGTRGVIAMSSGLSPSSRRRPTSERVARSSARAVSGLRSLAAIGP